MDEFLIDRALPDHDADIAVRIVVEATPRVTWDAARDLDFLTVRTPPTTVGPRVGSAWA